MDATLQNFINKHTVENVQRNKKREKREFRGRQS
jgi:hypothetical protein